MRITDPLMLNFLLVWSNGMNFLVVEDENTKYNDICDVINCIDFTTIERANNAKEAMRLLRNKAYDIILLDMTLPYSKDNRKLNTYAGKELLFDMQIEEIEVPTIVITRYTNFGSEQTDLKPFKPLTYLINDNWRNNNKYQFEQYDITHFEGLHNYLKNEIAFYIGIVFFTQQNDSWKNNLLELIGRIKKDEYTDCGE